MELRRGEARYPALLAQCADAPAVLRVRGALTPDDERCVAVVGTRALTPYGERAARDVATDLAQAGFTIVSGLAQGIDEVAHRAALAAGGRTIAVLGCGLDAFRGSVTRRALFASIAARCAVVTEHEHDVAATRWTYPARNRIIAGLALATVVVEAGAPSGALITAARALDYDRLVFAVPGGVYAPKSVGCNRLIAEARARLCRSAADVLADLGASLEPSALPSIPLSTLERAVLEIVSADAIHVDRIARAVRRPVDEVSATLTLLELRDLVRCIGDGRFVGRGPSASRAPTLRKEARATQNAMEAGLMKTTKDRAYVALFDERTQAQKVADELRAKGFRDDQIGYAWKDEGGETRKIGETKAGELAAQGAVTGGVLGGAAGALAAGLIPGVGPIVAAGILASTLTGAAAGAAAGGLAGALVGMGIPEEEARFYEEEFKRGRVVMTVRAGDRYDEVADVVRRTRGYDYETRADRPTREEMEVQTRR